MLTNEDDEMKKGSVVDYKMTVDKIADCMQLCGMRQVDMARELHCSEVTVSQWLHGDTFPNLDTLVRIADMFNMYLDDLIVRI